MTGRPWIRIQLVKPDARGWIAVGCYSLVLVVLFMISVDNDLLNNDAFLILATAIVITGWVQGPVGWAYQATKGGGDAAESHARIAEQAASAVLPTPAHVPHDAQEAAEQVAEAAVEAKDGIVGAEHGIPKKAKPSTD